MKNFKSKNRRKKLNTPQGGSLHKVWDRILGNGRTFNRLRRDASDLLSDDELNDCGNDCAMNLDPVVWMNESHQLAKDVAYGQAIIEAVVEAEESEDLSRIELSQEYFDEAAAVSQKRAVMAGFRLSTFFEDVIPHEHDEDE